MTSVYMTKTSYRPRSRREKKPDEDEKPVPGALCAGFDAMREQFESTLADDSIEVQYLDLPDLMDNGPLAMCSKNCVETSLITYEIGMDTSADEIDLIDNGPVAMFSKNCMETSIITHETGMNTSADESFGNGRCFDKYDDSSFANGDPPIEFSRKNRDEVDNDNGKSLKKCGWMPRAVSDAWDNVASSNWQCWQGTHDPWTICSRDTVKDGKNEKIKTKKRKKTTLKMKRDSSYTVDPLEIKKYDEKKQESQKTDGVEPQAIEKLPVDEKKQESPVKNVVETPPTVKSLVDEKKQESPKKDVAEPPMIKKKQLVGEKKQESPKKDVVEPPAIKHRFSDEPNVARRLFDTAGKENTHPSEDESPSMSCINSESLPKLDDPNVSKDSVDGSVTSTRKEKMKKKWLKKRMMKRF